MFDLFLVDLFVIYVFLMLLKFMLDMEGYWKKVVVVVLGYIDEFVIQEYVVDVLVGKVVVDGCLLVVVVDLFKLGDGVIIIFKVFCIYRFEDYGMDFKILEKIDRIVMEGIKVKVYFGCQILILKDGKLVYDKFFGIFIYESD